MKLKFAQLSQHLKSDMHLCYWIAGDEPLQARDAGDMIRQTAREAGYTEREVHDADKQFKWDVLHHAASSMSLFSDKKLIEIRLNNKPDDAARKAIIEYLDSPPEDTILLLQSPRLEAAATKSKWFQSIEKHCAYLPLYDIDAGQLNDWLRGRLQRYQMSATPEAIRLIAERTEGNLLAADQEIEKFYMLYGAGNELDLDAVSQTVTDNARFNVFALIENCLAGNTAKSLATLQRLREEGNELLYILAMIAREIRQLLSMKAQMEQGAPIGSVLKSFRVWGNRQSAVEAALQRHSKASLSRLLAGLHAIDAGAKGLRPGDTWVNLEKLVTSLCTNR